MKWAVRVLAGMIIALLISGATRGLIMYRAAGLLGGFVIFFVGVYEGVDMSGFWGDDDDDDQQGPVRPA